MALEAAWPGRAACPYTVRPNSPPHILAAEQGDASAQWGLGRSYAVGAGVPQDSAEAIRWFRLAADQGLAEARYGRGVLYTRGEGVLEDYVQAHMWYNLAAARGTDDENREEAVQARTRVAESMTPDQIAWTRLTEDTYYSLLAELRAVLADEDPWWKLEKYWNAANDWPGTV